MERQTDGRVGAFTGDKNKQVVYEENFTGSLPLYSVCVWTVEQQHEPYCAVPIIETHTDQPQSQSRHIM